MSSSLIRELERAGVTRIVTPEKRWNRDYSIFSLEPRAIVRPETESDCQKTLHIAREWGVPVVPRSGGSNTGGAAITDGILLLIDQGAFMECRFSEASGLLSAGSGVRHDAVQRALREVGLWLPSDPSSGPLSCIGGNVATRASGPHALRHGAIHRYVRELRFITSDGTIIDTRDPGSIPRSLTDGLRHIAWEICSDPTLLAQLEARRDQKRAAGYDLLALADHRREPALAIPRLLTGAMGTLGIVTEAVFAPARLPERFAAAVLRFGSPEAACEASLALRSTAAAIEILLPSALRYLDSETFSPGQTHLLCEWSGDDSVRAVAEEAVRAFDPEPSIETEPAAIKFLWKQRKTILLRIRRASMGAKRAYSVVNDIGADPSDLSSLIGDLTAIFDRRKIVTPIYGHAGSGNLHLRPLFDSDDSEALWETALEVYTLVGEYGGSISPEHGMGRLRAPFLDLEWSDSAVRAMRAVKRLFDPEGLLNPDVMFTTSTAEGVSGHGWSIDPDLA